MVLASQFGQRLSLLHGDALPAAIASAPGTSMPVVLTPLTADSLLATVRRAVVGGSHSLFVLGHLHLGAFGEPTVELVVVDRVLVVDEGIDVVLRQAQDRHLGIAVDDVAAILRVERAQLLDVDARHGSNLPEMYVAVDHQRIGLCGQRGAHRTDIVVAIIGHDVVGSDESRHISLRLARQILIDGPIVFLSPSTVDGLVDVLRSAVVGSNDEAPVVIDAEEVAQIACRSVRRLDGVAPLVDQRGHFQPVLLACSEHKLPQSGSAHTRCCLGREGRLDDRQVLQFQGQVVGFERLFEDGHVEVAGSEHIAHRAAQLHRIAVDKLAYHLVVGHLHD